MRQRYGRAAAILYALAWIGYGAVYLSGASAFWRFDGPVLVAAALIVTGVVVHRPRRTPAWLALVAGMALLVGGDAIWYATEQRGLDPFPSTADLLYLAGLPLLAAGIGGLASVRDRGRDRTDLVDTGIIVTSVAFLVWILLAAPWAAATLPPLGRQVVVAYPVAGVLVLAAAVRLVLGYGGRSPSTVLLVVGAAGLLVTDGIYATLSLGGAYRAGGVLDLGSLAAYACWAAAALHPSMRGLSEARPRPAARIGHGRLAVLWAMSVAVPTAAAVQHLRGVHVDALLEVAVLLVLFTLVSLRMARVLRVNERLARRQGEDRLRALVHHIDEAVIVLGDGDQVTYASPAADRLWGSDRTVDVERPVHQADRGRLRAALARQRAGGYDEVLEVRGHPGQHPTRDPGQHYEVALTDLRDDPGVGGVVVAFRDVSERKGLEAQLVHHAFHDPLTGLANRRLLLDRIGQVLARRDDASGVALLFIDLDDFKGINDGLGHEAGDALLCEVAGRLLEHVRDGDTAARLGGDEFAVLATPATAAQAEHLAQRLVAALARPARIHGKSVDLGASVGVAVAAAGEARADVLLRNADIAMYAAKTAGKHRYELYDGELHEQDLRRAGRKADLRRALAGEQLWLAYQPVYALAATGGDDLPAPELLAGFSSRLYWDHESGAVGGDELVLLAEESGVIGEIGRWVLEQVCREAATWPGGPAGPLVGVDLAGGHLRDARVVRDVEHALRSSGLAPHRLVLQLTEPALAEGAELVAARLRTLAALGVQLSVARFGTGRYPLAVLHRLPLHGVTLDRSLVDGIDEDPNAAALARGVLDLTRQLGLVALAEDVERPAQRDLLAGWGCAFGHGSLFSPPLPPAGARALLEPAPAPTPRRAISAVG